MSDRVLNNGGAAQASSVNRTAERHARNLRVRRGSGVMEAALVLPILVSLSLGMVEFGQYFYAKHTIQAAARDGARAAIIPSATNAQVTTAVSNTMSSANFGSSGYTTTIQDSGGATIADLTTVARGTGVKVTVSVNYGKVGVRPLGIISATKPVTGITTMVKE